MATAAQPISVGSMIVEAETRCAAVSLQWNHLALFAKKKSVLQPRSSYRLDLCVTPRLKSRVQFEHWPASRFAQAGSLFVVPPGASLAIWNELGRETVILCNLFTDAMSQLLWDDFEPHPQTLDAGLDMTSEPIDRALRRMAAEARSPGFASELMIEGLALQIAVELHRRYREPMPDMVSGGLAPWRLRLIDDRLQSSTQAPTLSELARLCNLSVRQLSRGFRESRGISIGNYVSRQRIDDAKQLLMADHCVKEIAARLGFASSASFCAAFRSAMGLTPKDYRELIRTN